MTLDPLVLTATGRSQRRSTDLLLWLLRDGRSVMLGRVTDLTMLVVALVAIRVVLDIRIQALVFAYPVLVIGVLHLRDFYRRAHMMILDSLAQVVGATSVAAMLLLAVGGLLNSDPALNRLVAYAWLVATVSLCAGHESVKRRVAVE